MNKTSLWARFRRSWLRVRRKVRAVAVPRRRSGAEAPLDALVETARRLDYGAGRCDDTDDVKGER